MEENTNGFKENIDKKVKKTYKNIVENPSIGICVCIALGLLIAPELTIGFMLGAFIIHLWKKENK
jgi:hypothetical protein